VTLQKKQFGPMGWGARASQEYCTGYSSSFGGLLQEHRPQCNRLCFLCCNFWLPLPLFHLCLSLLVPF